MASLPGTRPGRGRRVVNYSAAWFSRLRHKYQLATEQYGRQLAASSSICLGCGSSSNPYALRMADAYAQIAGRQHVRPPQREDQEHVRGPHADAFHLRQMLDHLVVRQAPRSASNCTCPSQRFPRQIANIGGLLLRQARACRIWPA